MIYRYKTGNRKLPARIFIELNDDRLVHFKVTKRNGQYSYEKFTMMSKFKETIKGFLTKTIGDYQNNNRWRIMNRDNSILEIRFKNTNDALMFKLKFNQGVLENV
jgi:hypothetical protein